MYQRFKKYDRALDSLDKAITEQPENKSFYVSKYKILLNSEEKSGYFTKTEMFLDDTIQKFPDEFRFYGFKMRVYEKMGLSGEKGVFALSIVDKFPDKKDIVLTAIGVSMYKGNYQEAQKIMDRYSAHNK